MKITRNVLLIGIVAGLLIYCMINDCDLREGFYDEELWARKEKKKNKKNQGIMGKVTGVLGNTVSSVVSATGNAAANTLKETAKIAGKGVNVVKTSGKIFTNQSNRNSDI